MRLILLLVAAATRPLCGGVVLTMEDIRYWVGDGANEAVLVVDWDEPSERHPLAWGFRWDGVATGEDMFRAIAAADHRFFGRLGAAGPFGVPLYGIGYDRDNDGFELSDGTNFVDGVAVTGPSDSATAVDPRDSYNEGWDFGFWNYYEGDGQPYAGGAWTVAESGFSLRMLTTGDWDGYSFAPGFEGLPPEVPNAAVDQPRTDVARIGNGDSMTRSVPEPAATWLWWWVLAVVRVPWRHARTVSS